MDHPKSHSLFGLGVPGYNGLFGNTISINTRLLLPGLFFTSIFSRSNNFFPPLGCVGTEVRIK